MRLLRVSLPAAATAAAALLCVLPVPAMAQTPVTFFSDFGPGNSFTNGGSNIVTGPNVSNLIANTVVSVEFNSGAQSGMLSSIQIAPVKIAGNSSGLIVSLTSESGGVPGAILESISGNSLNGPGVVTFSSATNPTLAANTLYFVMVQATGDGGALLLDNNQSATGTIVRTSNAGPGYSISNNATLPAFAVKGITASVAPEPGTFPLVGMGLATGLGMTARRRKQARTK